MRKIFWLALGLGVAELVKRQAAKHGISPTAFISNFASNIIARLKGEEADHPA
jgi:hypothetical protein